MAATPSTMLPLGTPAADFELVDPASGRNVRLADFADARALVVLYLCNHCPFVKHLRTALGRVAQEYEPRGVAFVAINSNDAERYPDDAPDKMAAEAREAGWSFPYLFDATQSVAKAYRAACTPDFFVFAADRRLAYRGQFDASRPSTRSFAGNNSGVTGQDLRRALDSVLAGRGVAEPHMPSIGCNIKWKPGNEPEYAR